MSRIKLFSYWDEIQLVRRFPFPLLETSPSHKPVTGKGGIPPYGAHFRRYITQTFPAPPVSPSQRPQNVNKKRKTVRSALPFLRDALTYRSSSLNSLPECNYSEPHAAEWGRHWLLCFALRGSSMRSKPGESFDPRCLISGALSS